MKKRILYILLIAGILLVGSIFLIGGFSISFFLPIEPSCGDEYNSAFRSSLERKDISFCWNEDYAPQTTQWRNGIIVENICKNYDGKRIRVDEETCVETFAKHHNQPQLCALLQSLSGKSLYEELTEENKNIVDQYVGGTEVPLLDGEAMDCAIEYRNEKDSFEGCNYLDKDYSKGYSIEEICIRSYYTKKSPSGTDGLYGCDKYDFKSPKIREKCGYEG